MLFALLIGAVIIGIAYYYYKQTECVAEKRAADAGAPAVASSARPALFASADGAPPVQSVATAISGSATPGSQRNPEDSLILNPTQSLVPTTPDIPTEVQRAMVPGLEVTTPDPFDPFSSSTRTAIELGVSPADPGSTKGSSKSDGKKKRKRRTKKKKGTNTTSGGTESTRTAKLVDAGLAAPPADSLAPPADPPAPLPQ